MALKKVRGNIERMFDKNLTDLVRGIRNSKENEVCANYWEIEFKKCHTIIIFVYTKFEYRLNTLHNVWKKLNKNYVKKM